MAGRCYVCILSQTSLTFFLGVIKFVLCALFDQVMQESAMYEISSFVGGGACGKLGKRSWRHDSGVSSGHPRDRQV